MSYILQLGRTTELCLYEVKQLFTGFLVSEIDAHHVIVRDIAEELFLPLIARSAGVTKALQVEVIHSNLKHDDIEKNIVDYFFEHSTKDFTIFSKSELRDQWNEVNVKKQLRVKGLSTRFLDKTAALGASAAILLHQNITELGIFTQENTVIFAKTIWSQNIDHWTVKDREKPYADRKKGMLPPKVARMMLNMVSAKIVDKKKKVLYDPFCGTATVLMEGLESGWYVVGSDISQKTITSAADNMHWFVQKFNLPEDVQLFVGDASQITRHQLPTKVDAIVTEPFLGKQTPDPKELSNIFKGLEKMYLGAFKKWTTLLNNGGEVIIVTPHVNDKGTHYDLRKLIDKLSDFGYSILSGPLAYSREDAIVQRSIYHLKYTSK